MPRRPDLSSICVIGGGPDRDRPGVRVRLLREPGAEGAARRGVPDDRRQLEPGDDHDRPRLRRPHLPRAARRRGRDRRPRARAARRTAADARRPDGAQSRAQARRGRGARRARRRADRRRLRRHPTRRGPRALPRDDGERRAARAGIARWSPRPTSCPRRSRSRSSCGRRSRSAATAAASPARPRSSSASSSARSARARCGQVLVEESLVGWDEFELEVMRDARDNVVVVCSIENLDPMGVHTGDSVTVAPQMTLSDEAFQELRDAAAMVIRAVGVETGGSNIQFARERETGELRVIEMNPRVSRSSALASKATGYPIAKVAAKLAVGYTLDEIPNDLTRTTPASFEPTLDYVVVKFPRFAFEKFPGADEELGTQMKSVGEAMGIGRTFTEAFLKAMRSRELEPGAADALGDPRRPSRRPAPVVSGAARARVPALDAVSTELRPRRGGLAPAEAARLGGRRPRRARGATSEDEVRRARRSCGVRPSYRRVDSCAAEVEASSNYLYSTWGEQDEARPDEEQPRVVILGSGPNRIGQGIEFDYCCVHAGADVPRARLRDGDGQLQPRDGLDRLRHVRPALLRAAPRRGGARDLRPRAARGRRHPVRRPDAAQARARARAGGVPDPRDAVRGGRPRRGSRALRRPVRAARDRGPRLGHGGRPGRARRPSPRQSATRCSCGRRTCSAAAACASATSPRTSARGRRSRPGAGRPLPRGRRRARRRRALRRRGHLGRRAHGARRGGRRPFRRLLLRAARRSGLPNGVLAECVDTVERLAPALGVVGLINVQLALQDGRLYVLEANPRASRTVPFVSKALGVNLVAAACRLAAGAQPGRRARRRAARRPAPRLRQGVGLPVRALSRARRGARPGDALDRRGDGQRGGLPDRVRQGRARGRTPASERRHGVPLGARGRQARRRRPRPEPGGAGLRALRHRRHGLGARRRRARGHARPQGLGGRATGRPWSTSSAGARSSWSSTRRTAAARAPTAT